MPHGTGLKALLLDDDEYAIEFLQAILLDRYPGLEIERRLEPDPTGEFDLYFLDDDFEGIRLAGRLARRIRAQRPRAVIIAFSASLDRGTLKELLNAGCSGVCDKKVPTDMPRMLESLDRAVETLEEERSRPPDTLSGSYLVRTFKDLFQEWNRRLEAQE
ncbi:MAG TPA: response regulator [Planctomycetes bacterium]|nr:response regulator [Planctomycetota bacterium]